MAKKKKIWQVAPTDDREICIRPFSGEANRKKKKKRIRRLLCKFYYPSII